MIFAKRSGFTLIELLVTITIVAIISSIGFASYSNAQKFARDARRKSDLGSIATALELYRQKNGHYPCTTITSGQRDQFNTSTYWQNSAQSTTWIIDNNNTTCTATTPPIFDTNYINKIPSDPTANNGNPIFNTALLTNYGYGYWAGATGGSGFTAGCPNDPAGGSYYILAALLENPNDPDTNGLKHYKYCDNSTEIRESTQTYYKNLYIITSP